MAEIFRAGILSIHSGQLEAALTVGMTPLAAMRWVILPQALRVVMPPLANFGIALLKDTSVASIISAPELMLRARDLASSSFCRWRFSPGRGGLSGDESARLLCSPAVWKRGSRAARRTLTMVGKIGEHEMNLGRPRKGH